MIGRTIHNGRLLPWSSPEGKPCYLIGDGTGYLSRVADNIESVQLGMAAELLGHAADMVDDRQVTPEQLRFVVARMAEALRDVHRIARSRGARLPVPVLEDQEGEASEEEEGDTGPLDV
ncbi:hypothetical protein [Streptomyces narbonensis]|uniref:hypothetical protein n=1 Tax=Streptomyces narbonensis TaxID=67333 RepID=UPI001676FCC8|nr:hypothetical protein [Streptomyces narbonensis]GGV92855.1 hypothetical protein GCM10010230_02150 [Streptomyces narbonensis]